MHKNTKNDYFQSKGFFVHKNKYLKCCICLVLFLCIVTQTGCTSNSQEPISKTDYLLNTVCRITIYGSSDESLIDEAFELCRKYENQFSRTIGGSDVDRINRSQGEAVKIETTTEELLAKALYYGDLSDGAFDITVGRLSELWDFGGTPTLPDREELEVAVSEIGYQNVKVDGGRAWLENSNARLDLGGIAKGYILDQAAAFLKEEGVKSALLDFGGDIVCVGKKPDGSLWNVAVQKPFSDGDGGTGTQFVGTVKVEEKTVVTSGTYERQFVEGGILYHHILDPATGYPVESDLDGITIIGDYAVDCDALATTCLLIGSEKAIELLENMSGVEGVLILKNGEILQTGGAEMDLL